MGDQSSLATAMEAAKDAVFQADHMPDWLQLVKDSDAEWTMELRRGGGVWKGSFKVGCYSEAGHPALYSLLADAVLKRKNPRRQADGPKDRIQWMEELEAAAAEIKGPLEYQFTYLEFYRNKHNDDLLEGTAQHVTATREQVEEVLKRPTSEMLRDTKELVDDTLERDQHLADWLYLLDDTTTVKMEVRRGEEVWEGTQAMKELTYSAQVLLFDAMHGGDIKRQ